MEITISVKDYHEQWESKSSMPNAENSMQMCMQGNFDLNPKSAISCVCQVALSWLRASHNRQLIATQTKCWIQCDGGNRVLNDNDKQAI